MPGGKIVNGCVRVADLSKEALLLAECLSDLERAVLLAMHTTNRDDGFPSPDEVEVLRRENTGGGRYVDLSTTDLPRRPLTESMLLNVLIEMEGLPNGLQAFGWLESGRLVQLEFCVIGRVSWDGVERPWRIVSVGL